MQENEGSLLTPVVLREKLDIILMVTPEEALLSLTLKAGQALFLEDAKRTQDGKIEQIELPWLEKGHKKHSFGDSIVMGYIVLKQGRLVLGANFGERAQMGRELLKKYLGESIIFQQTLIETPEQKLQALSERESKSGKRPHTLALSTDAQEKIKEMALAHWSDWLDTSIPALNDKTPREATETVSGRERLDASLLEYECHDVNVPNNTFKADIQYLRAELGL